MRLHRSASLARPRCSSLLCRAALVCLTAASGVVAGETTLPLTYERDIRPIFKTHCFHCHGEDGRREGELDLRLRRLIMAGGESGDVVVPGKPDESFLLERMLDGDMPPEEVKLRPTADEIEKIRQWITAGAPTARPEPTDLDPDNYITEEERSYWAFQPIVRPNPPQVRHVEQVRTPIDRFVLAKLEPLELTLSPDADRRTLIRRLTIDLHGLPPSPEEVEAFVSDDRPDAYERLVERLLESPRYGERWGRHWLDVAGYADSEGYTETDPVRPYAYKYRDYVIRSFNEDKPFDQFIVEQLAGDELVSQSFKNLSPAEQEKLIATGFLRMTPDGTGDGGVDQIIARDDVMAGTIEIVSSALLGLTVGCARCHNHRYDPIPQSDYYALRAIFEPALDPRSWLPPAKRRISLYSDADRKRAAEIEKEAQAILATRSKKQQQFIDAVFERELAKLPQELRPSVRKARETPAQKRTAEQKSLLKKYPSVNVTAGSLYLYDRKAADELKKLADQAAKLRASKPKEEQIRCVWETGSEPPPTRLFARGDPEQPKQVVPPHALSVLTGHAKVTIPLDDPKRPTTGRRLAYARWLTSGRHPTVARVIVNRVWMWHFGRPLVPTPSDFGRLGVSPTHPQLLDWLAAEFMAGGWSMKELHRLIVCSTVYRQASTPHDRGNRHDAQNRLWWRRSLVRLDAETLRDTVLAVSGELNEEMGGPPVPVMADRIGQFVIGKENLNAGRPGPVIDMKGQQFRRTVYVQFRRSRPLSTIASFDLPRMNPNCSARSSSTVSPQSLLLMNSPFVVERAKKLAERLEQEAGTDVPAQIRRLWLVCYGRPPRDTEMADASGYIEEQTELFAQQLVGKKKKTPQQAARDALASLCHAVLSSNEFLYVE